MTGPVPILLYHSVSADPPSWIAPFAVSPATFAAHLELVMASGREALTVSQYLDGLRGKTALPQRPVLITVDDGFADFADHALPALAARNLPSTLYVTTGALAGGAHETVLPTAAMLRGADLPGLEAAGVEIGAHSHTHRQLDLLPKREVAAELARSRDVLADVLGHGIRSFAYPHSYWRPLVLRLVREAGYDSACAVGNRLSSAARDHHLALTRLMVRADTGADAVAAWLNGPGTGALPRRRRVLAFGWRQYRRARQPQRGRWSP
ncbi:MAG: polysaccharide deacetylase family protein [Nocardiopsaceae bacterium]|jgi:peptidoglycan/xylan/chitin deacetylase (PgdA/CDA1 family)|nr:polysaccharide deacetylase family protein [Nocardiopsaceae bacterium]